ncbi:MAG: type II toxin-antitoxin system PemK/MazF family toxin [Marinomonas sp.]
MALKFHPNPGTLLICDFDTGFQVPEMTKKRPVIVISPKRKNCSGLCTVVAISTVVPDHIEKWHYHLPMASMPNVPNFQRKDSWVKGDMIYRVSFERLSLIRTKRDTTTGKRDYFTQTLGRKQMKSIYSCVLNALNLEALTPHLDD